MWVMPFLFMALHAASVAATVNIVSDAVTAKEGEDVILHCALTTTDEYLIGWHKLDFFDARTSLRTPGRTLTLWNLTIADAGRYVCSLGTYTQEQKLDVELKGEPIIEVPIRRVYSPMGRSVTLECRVTAHPVLDSQWLKGGAQLRNGTKYRLGWVQNDQYTYTMRLSLMVAAADYGGYECMVQNPHDVTVRTVLLEDTVMYVPKVSEIPTHQVVIARKDVRFNCTVGTYFSDKDWLIWYWISPLTGNTTRIFAAQVAEQPTDGVKAHPEKYSFYGRYNLIVRDVRYEDQGTYICAIRDQINHTASLSVVDAVRCGQRAVLVREEDEAFLWCSMRAEGTALWDVQWQHKARKLVSVNLDVPGMIYRHLTFRSRPSDSGSYMCTMQSANPPFRQQCVLTLQVTPKNTTTEEGPATSAQKTEDNGLGDVTLIALSVAAIICVFGLATLIIIIYRRRKGASKRSPSKSTFEFRLDAQGSPSSNTTVATGLSLYGVV